MLRTLLAATILTIAAPWALPSHAVAQGPSISRTPSRGGAFGTLGPLSSVVMPGTTGPWTVRDSGGQAALSNQSAAGAVRFYTTDWQGDLASGRSVSVRAAARGSAGFSATGLLFRLTNEDPKWLAFVVGADGKLGLYARLANELKRTGTYDIPGGHLAAGDVLSINQTGDVAQLLVNGYLVDELKPVGKMSPNAPAPVGIVAMGQGDFTLGNFAFGRAIPPIAPAAPNTGNDDTVTPPSAGNDNPPQTPTPGPTPPTSRLTEVPSMGPLGHDLHLGDNSGWTIAVTNGELVFKHNAEDDLYYFNRSVAWAGDPDGRSASVAVAAGGTTDKSGGGLLFGLTKDGKAFWELLATGDGKIRLFHVRDDTFYPGGVFDPPPGAGGPRTLKISQRGDQMSLYADGKLLKVLSGDEPDGFAADGRVGISMRGNGIFAFRDFAFAGPEAATPPPVIAPPPNAPGQTTEVPALGPLGHNIKLGDNSGWDTSVQNGAITYAHVQDDDAGYFYRTIAWPTPATSGHSATVTVMIQADADESGGGLTFGLAGDSKKLLMFAATGDGKVRLFKIADNDLSTMATFGPSIDPANNRRTLQVSQKGSSVGLYIDGRLVKTMSAGDLGDMDGDVGIGVLNKGRYSFRDFAFGPALASTAAPPPSLTIPNLTPRPPR